jgi:cytoskeletal protein RodZ
MDFLLDNGFFILLGIAVFVVRLFLQFQAKDRKKNLPPRNSAHVQPEDAEDSRIFYANTRSASDYFKEQVKKPRTAPAQKAVPVQAQAADFRPHWLEPEEKPKPAARKAPRKQPAAVARTALPSAEPELTPETPKPAPRIRETAVSGFPANLASLPPLKQAVVLAEILGNPRGLD